MKRYSVFAGLLAVLVFTALAPTYSSNLAQSAVNITKGPYLQNVTADSIVIMWETDVPSTSTVVYGDNSMAYDPLETIIHEVTLSGLKADAIYLYQVASGSTSSEICSFKTAPLTAKTFRFAIVGDTQRTNTDPTALESVLTGIIGSSSDLLLHTGDLVSYGSVDAEWDYFFDKASDLLKLIPMFPAIGNHETYYESSAMQFFKYFSLPNDGTEHGWYAFEYGNVQFICLDTEHLSTAQDTWLAGQLADSTSKWKIVYFHEPPFTDAGRGDPSIYVVTNWLPLFREYGVNIVFSGHTHAYERYYDAISDTSYIVAGGGNNFFSHWSITRALPSGISKKLAITDTPHYCTVDVAVDDSGSGLTLNAWNASTGELFDSITHGYRASNPYPGNGLVNVQLSVTLNWDTGFAASEHKIYFSSDAKNWSLGATTTSTSLPLKDLAPNTTYYWRVDEVQTDTSMVTEGVPWSFRTQSQLVVKSIVTSTVSATSGSVYGRATVTIVDGNGKPVLGATVKGSFTIDFSGENQKSGVTNKSGIVVFTTSGTHSRKPPPSFGFEVTSFSK
jgi:hypothetical protein